MLAPQEQFSHLKHFRNHIFIHKFWGLLFFVLKEKIISSSASNSQQSSIFVFVRTCQTYLENSQNQYCFEILHKKQLHFIKTEISRSFSSVEKILIMYFSITFVNNRGVIFFSSFSPSLQEVILDLVMYPFPSVINIFTILIDSWL